MTRRSPDSAAAGSALVVLVVASIVAAALVAGVVNADDEAKAAPPRAVLVELFTSQGCSSCPPADRLLTELAADGSRGVDVIALSYHVDYWNYIGWTDPFSSAAWSDRQRTYARQLARDRVYTPQVVIDGVSECVGSDRREVVRHIAGAAGRAPGAAIKADRGADGRWTIAASLPASAEGPARVQLAVFETELTTEVKRGENAQRTLHNDNVVRRLTTLAELSPGEQWRAEHTPDLDPAWRGDRLGVALFVQSVPTLEVLAATSSRF